MMLHNQGKAESSGNPAPKCEDRMTPANPGSAEYMLAISAAHSSVASRAEISFYSFQRFASEWACYPVRAGGSICGALLAKDAEIHACISPSAFGVWLTRGALALLDSISRRFGLVFSRASTDAGRVFLERLGFSHAGHDIYVRMRHGH